jgi:aspartate racemase
MGPQKVVGILGGMGPASTAALFLEIVRATPISREQDHLRIIVDNNPKVPDRTEVLQSGDTGSAIRELCETARNLERAGAEVIGMPCNTAHAFLAEIRASVGVQVLDMVDEAVRATRRLHGKGAVIGLVATDGTLETGLYRQALERHGLVAVGPGCDTQAAVMDVIAGVKLGEVSERSRELLAGALEDLSRQGAGFLIAACTEISLVFRRHPPELGWVDPLRALARALVREAIGPGA